MLSNYELSFRPIARKFARSLVTSYGVWEVREAIILRLTDTTGKTGWGEIAPISWFGSETLEEALDFCRQLPKTITEERIFSIPDDLPACQFGFESALEEMGSGEDVTITNAQFSALLPAGEAALHQWRGLWEEGYRTFKWKIGVGEIAQELKIFDSLIKSLPASAKLRLDANGGLSYQEANSWLQACDNSPIAIEFMEQPLPVEQFSQMLELSEAYTTAIALDESVATLKQLAACYAQGWREVFVIKPAIAGSPSRLRKFCQQHEIDAVFSSVFETAIARQAALKLATELSRYNRAVGFGVNHLFKEEEENWQDNFSFHQTE
ncbi:o-succinylbenzoate synthase [Anabaena subtropica]|uniref:o-succinylbenzoate synthase n=1 Tax=Anabaena subtropica FACHB-260 TaxID=2692884 RepID=A0ABR8CPE9_9NOST|nr:o-succinylbenzoate synthase [Anabaena subtropica]MBD2343680.1 o-succinylbenzoate synthase [Anabaena subtropica FACHB-260]